MIYSYVFEDAWAVRREAFCKLSHVRIACSCSTELAAWVSQTPIGDRVPKLWVVTNITESHLNISYSALLIFVYRLNRHLLFGTKQGLEPHLLLNVIEVVVDHYSSWKSSQLFHCGTRFHYLLWKNNLMGLFRYFLRRLFKFELHDLRLCPIILCLRPLGRQTTVITNLAQDLFAVASSQYAMNLIVLSNDIFEASITSNSWVRLL